MSFSVGKCMFILFSYEKLILYPAWYENIAFVIICNSLFVGRKYKYSCQSLYTILVSQETTYIK